MADAPTPLRVTRLDADGLHRHRQVLVDVYAEVYADRVSDPFFSPSRYWERLVVYGMRDGFALVAGHVGEELVGYAMGFPLPEWTGWWKGLIGAVDPALLVEDGTRTFAITEIMIREPWRRQGHARALHDTLLSGRPEQRGALLVLPGNDPAQAAYRSWGWSRLAGLRPFEDGPVYDAMVLDISLG